MTDTPPKPKRRRWRSIIVGVFAGILLMVTGVTGWRYWPRVDSRFVGKWQLTFHRMHDQVKVKELVVVLRSDGTASYVDPIGGRRLLPLKWSVGGTTYRHGSPTSIKRLNAAIHHVQRRLPRSLIRFWTESISEWKLMP